MKNYQITEVQKNEILTYLGDVPSKFANPLINFISGLPEVKDEEEAKPELIKNK